MKLKSLQLNHNIAILIENYDYGLRIYYADGHYEIMSMSIHDLERVHTKNYKYKNPIRFGTSLLYPTQNQRDYECKWVNIEYLSEGNEFFLNLLKEKKLEKIIQKMYAQYIQKSLF